MQLAETIFVSLLFLLYLLLWRIKQINQKKHTGIDPKVMANFNFKHSEIHESNNECTNRICRPGYCPAFSSNPNRLYV